MHATDGAMPQCIRDLAERIHALPQPHSGDLFELLSMVREESGIVRRTVEWALDQPQWIPSLSTAGGLLLMGWKAGEAFAAWRAERRV